jgi:hypothetical protein
VEVAVLFCEFTPLWLELGGLLLVVVLWSGFVVAAPAVLLGFAL